MKLKKLKKDGDPGPGAVAEAEQQWNGSEVSGTNEQEREGDISAEYASSNSTYELHPFAFIIGCHPCVAQITQMWRGG
jgi:hypothetical protein